MRNQNYTKTEHKRILVKTTEHRLFFTISITKLNNNYNNYFIIIIYSLIFFKYSPLVIKIVPYEQFKK